MLCDSTDVVDAPHQAQLICCEESACLWGRVLTSKLLMCWECSVSIYRVCMGECEYNNPSSYVPKMCVYNHVVISCVSFLGPL